MPNGWLATKIMNEKKFELWIVNEYAYTYICMYTAVRSIENVINFFCSLYAYFEYLCVVSHFICSDGL